MSADITIMYRQVVLDEAHRKFQLIIWRETPQDPLQIYRLNTVTYGTASAPFLGEIYSDSLPLASQALANHFYDDDRILKLFSFNCALICQNLRHSLQIGFQLLTNWLLLQSGDTH